LTDLPETVESIDNLCNYEWDIWYYCELMEEGLSQWSCPKQWVTIIRQLSIFSTGLVRHLLKIMW